MKQIKKIFFIVMLFGIMVLIKNTNVQAASANLTANTTKPTPGQTVTVSGSVTAGAWNVKLSGNGQSKTIYGYTTVNGNATGADSISFTAGAAGTKYTFSLTGGMTDINSSGEESVNKSITIEVVASNNGGGTSSNGNSGSSSSSGESSSKSSNANLSNLGLKTYDFTGFRAAITSYNVTVPNNVTSVQVYATVQASGAKYSVSGNTNLQVGTNPVRVTVTAPDGKTKKTYTIYVARQADGKQEVVPNVIEEKPEEETKEEKKEEKKEALGLISIAIDENYEIYLEPEFKTNIYEYEINLKEDIDSIPLTAIPNRENVEITITGNENLLEGEENIITIEVKDKETEEKVIYTIKVNKMLAEPEEEKVEEEKQEEENTILHFLKENWVMIAIAGVAVLVITVTTILIIIKMKHDREDRMFFGDIEEKKEENFSMLEDVKKRKGKHF